MRIQTVLAAAAFIGVAGAAFAQEATPKKGIEEIVVTAERHTSTVQKTPISITAITGAQLQARGLTSVEDVIKELPGISVRSAGPGQTEYEARGLSSTGGAAPTVGFYLNDVPMSPPAAAQTGKVVIDPDLYDIQSVEVLRGPQGTLFGSGSMGGTIRVLTAQPSLTGYGGSIEATTSGTAGGNRPNAGINAAVNIPVTDNFALRIVGTDSERSGWIDRIVVDDIPTVPFAPGSAVLVRNNIQDAPVKQVVPDVNTEDLQGFRISALWKPTEDTTVKGMFLYQDLSMGGYDEFDQPPGNSSLAHYSAFNTAEPFSDVTKVLSLTAEHDFGFATLTSDTGFWKRNELQTQDASENVYTLGYLPLINLPYSEHDITQQFSEEIRLASPESNDRFRWVVGAFYDDLRSLWVEYSRNSYIQNVEGIPGGILFQSINPYEIRQIAFFANVSYKIIPTVELDAGFRVNRYENQVDLSEFGFVGLEPSQPSQAQKTKSAANSVTPKFTVSWTPNSDLLAYVTASQGYRPGGLNQQVPASLCGKTPEAYNADSVWNYEIGEKAKLLNGLVTLNSDFYYDDWSNIQQLLLLNCGYEYYDNAGNGRTFGPEIEVTAKLTPELTIAANGAYTDAKITKPIPLLAEGVVANAQQGSNPTCLSVANCTLPILNVPNYTGSVSLIYTTTVMDKYEFTGRITDNYVGPVTDEDYYPLVHLPPYNLVNLRGTISHGKWSVALFINNLTNVHAAISSNNTSFQFNTPGYARYSTNQPLTGGIDLSYKF
jgi:outer membrane receptor protein involved in Fe transport